MSQPARERDSGRAQPRPRLQRRRLFAATAAVVGHLLVFLVLVGSLAKPPLTVEPNAVTMTLVSLPPVVPAPPAAPAPTPRKPRPQPSASAAAPRPAPARPAPRRPPTPRLTPDALLASQARTPAPLAELSEAQLAGAITAGSGVGSGAGAGSGGGRACDMVRRLQTALRRDARIQDAVAEAHRGSGSSRAVLVWNGDWIRSGLEDGKGLAGVRQAIMVEVAFAPAACRAEPMHGLVLISLNDGPGAARLALGSGAWRWSDLLFAR